MLTDLQGTLTASLLTSRGRGAVATIGIRGDLSLLDHHFSTANGFLAAAQEIDRLCYGDWKGRGGEIPQHARSMEPVHAPADSGSGVKTAEDIVFVRKDERSAELHCHGGTAAVERILQDLRTAGATIVSPEVFLAASLSPVEFECRQALLQTTTRRTAHHVLRQVTLFPAAIRSLRQPNSVEGATADSWERHCEFKLQQLLRWSEFGKHLTQPWKVVLCGRPNVGKSSLINALVGYTRSIVFDQPGTTRDVVAVETSLAGWPVELSDTAGLRETDAELEAEGISRARRQLSQSDLVVIVLDVATGLRPEDEQSIAEFPDALIVRNKCDLSAPSPFVDEFNRGFEVTNEDRRRTEGVLPNGQRAFAVSAITSEGMTELSQQIVRRLVPEEPDSETPFPVTASQSQQLQMLLDILRQGRLDEFQRMVNTWVDVI